MLKTANLYDFSHSRAGEYLRGEEYPWQALPKIKTWILEIGKTLEKEAFDEVKEGVWVHRNATIAPTAFIAGPCIVDEGAEIRHCAFIRGNALVGKNCVVGNSVEVKNAILFDGVQIPHYNYVGDSVLGYKAHMGAGSVTSNVKSDRTLVVIKGVEEGRDTGLKKVGAFLGDGVEIGCNSVLNPGTIIGRNTTVYPLSSVRGEIAENSIYKREGCVVLKV